MVRAAFHRAALGYRHAGRKPLSSGAHAVATTTGYDFGTLEELLAWRDRHYGG